MHIDITHLSAQSTVVHLSGRFDFQAAPHVRQHLLDLIAEGYTHLIIDIGDVGFIASSGIGTLIGGLKATRQVGGNLCIARPSQHTQRQFTLTKLDRFFQLYQTVEEACISYQQSVL